MNVNKGNDCELERYDTKHRRIRGSLDYKYPPITAACKSECGFNDESIPRRDSQGHRCVLAVGHSGKHEWSWECQQMKARASE